MRLAKTGQRSRVTSEDAPDLVRRLAGHCNDITIAKSSGSKAGAPPPD